VQPFGLARARTIEIQPQCLRLGAQGLEIREIFERVGRVHVFFVGQRERAPVTVRERERARFILAAHENAAQAIVPRGRGLADATLDGVEIYRVTIVRVRAHNDMQARMVRIRDLHLRFATGGATDAIRDDLLNGETYFGVVPIART